VGKQHNARIAVEDSISARSGFAARRALSFCGKIFFVAFAIFVAFVAA